MLTTTPTADRTSDALAWFPHQMLIGGAWRDASDARSIAVSNPADGAQLTSVPDGTLGDGLEAVSAAAAALPAWSGTSPRQRSEILRRAYELMVEEEQHLTDLIVLENGKAAADARNEVRYAAEFFRWYAEEAVRLIGSMQRAPSGGNRILVTHQPIGVSLLVTPWNFPAAMATRKLGPALAAGCTTVLKPASETPLTALAIGHLLQRAGVPDGVVNVLPSSSSRNVVGTLLKDARVRKLSFTGSTAVGRHLLREAADSIVSCSMELGGNAPFIVLEDADVAAAVDGAMVAKMRNGGSACTAANRLLVHDSLVAPFTAALAERMSALSVGPGLDPGVQVGPMVNAATRDKVHELVEASVASGATVVAGGDLPSGAGYFYPPTVLSQVPAGAPVLREEIFGPVAPVVGFADDDEAVAIANDTEYGLVAYVFGKDLGRALRLADRLEVGMVGVNRGVVSDPAAPFGGFKQSGLGREGGHDGLLEFTESQYIAVEW